MQVASSMHGHVPSCSVCCPCLCAARLLLKCMHAVHCTCPAASCKMETALDTYLSGSQHARPNKRVKPCARTHHSLHAFPSSSSRRSRDAYERSTSRASRRSPQQVSKSGRVDESQIQRRLETGTGCRVTANVTPLKKQINKPHSLFTRSSVPYAHTAAFKDFSAAHQFAAPKVCKLSSGTASAAVRRPACWRHRRSSAPCLCCTASCCPSAPLR